MAKIQTCCHLWGASHFLLKAQQPKNIESTVEYFKLFLGVAKELQTFGLNYIPLRAKPQVPLLDYQSLWLLPESIQPKTLVSNIQPEYIIKILKKYKAPQS